MNLEWLFDIGNLAVPLVGWIYWQGQRNATWRKDTDIKLVKQDARIEATEKDLKRGDEKFDDMAADIKDMNASIHRMELALKGAVLKGVGNID